jgi:peroxiredoxin
MSTRARLLGIVTAAIVSTAAAAVGQVKRGDVAPSFAFGKTWNDAPTSFAELAGKIVIVEYVHPDHEVCKQSVTRMLDLHKKFAKRGVLVLGVSDESEAKIHDQFIKGLGAAYPWIKSNDFAKKYGCKYLPSAYCIDAYGCVFSLPDWWVPEDTTIEELLQALPLPPKLPADKQWDATRLAWQKNEYGKVREQIDKMLTLPALAADARAHLDAQKAALEQRQAAQVARVAELAAGPDFAAATSELERIEKAWPSAPPAAAARKELESFASDAKIQTEVTAGKALQKLMAGVDTSRIPALRKVIGDLDKFRKKHAGTHAGKIADQQHTRLCSRPDGS